MTPQCRSDYYHSVSTKLASCIFCRDNLQLQWDIEIYLECFANDPTSKYSYRKLLVRKSLVASWEKRFTEMRLLIANVHLLESSNSYNPAISTSFRTPRWLSLVDAEASQERCLGRLLKKAKVTSSNLVRGSKNCR